MKKYRPNLVLLWFLILIAGSLRAQDDLFDMLEEETSDENETALTYATFKDTRIVNGQSVETTSGGELTFVIQHRFGKINDGWYEFFGLDQATIRFGLEFGITDRLNVGIGRSSYLKTYDGYLKYQFLRQSAGAKSIPVTLAIYSNAAISATEWSEPERENYFTSRMTFATTLLLARKFSSAFSLQLTPSYVHRNLVETKDDQNDVFAIGIGGRVKISNRVSINGEYFYQLPGTNADQTYNSVALSVDIETGGHVFQIMATNSQGMIEQYFIANTRGDVLNGDIYFGFNISRVFNLKKKKDH
jgi:hypothetical protein